VCQEKKTDMATDEDKWLMEKLRDDNWQTWKFQMKHLLIAKGLWGVVDLSEVLATGASAEQRSAFQRKSQKAFSTIALSVSASKVYLISSCEEPNQAWNTLKKHYERDSLGSKLLLKKQYFRAQMEEGTSLEQHLKHMKELTDRLSAIGAAISEEDQVVTLLGSLPSCYATVVTALETRVEDVDMVFVQQALMNEEQKLQSAEAGVTSRAGTSALVGKHKRKGAQNTKKFKCYACGEYGHFRNECPNKEKSEVMEPGRNRHGAQNVEHGAHWDRGESVFVSGSHASKDCWLIDSGATSHMTSWKELISDYVALEPPEKVTLGDGSTVDAIGKKEVFVSICYWKAERGILSCMMCCMFRI